MKLWQFLSNLEVFEEQIASFYERLGALLGKDSEAGLFFKGLRNEEISQRDMVRCERRLLPRNNDDFSDIGLNGEDIAEAGRQIDELRSRGENLPVEELLKRAMELEGTAAEHLCRTARVQANPRLVDLINNLGAYEREHLETLGKFSSMRRRSKAGGEPMPARRRTENNL